MKPEAQEKTKTTDRDDIVCTPQLYKLICINCPGKKTGRRILRRSATAVVQTGEQPAGFTTCRPEIPAESRHIRPSGSAESGDTRPHMPADPQTMVPGLPEGARKSGPEIPAGTGQIGLQETAENKNNKAENPVPDTTGGGTP